ncbi:MAG TPA: protein kinase [Gemmatimonadales bacterium]|nr:protein kinase [Gemmatimonadales bacterium]
MPSLLESVSSALAGRYPIERELGRGGMATVYLARDPKHGRLVALKVLRPTLAAKLGLDRFLREIQVAAGLTHPHIVALHDSGESEGFLYYVMPYIEGESLRQRLSRETRLSASEAVKMGREVADALDYAHSRGVIHRDIKPENILLGAGHAVVSDFGIARALSAASVAEITAEGSLIGTPAYMSPEQADGRSDVDGRSDIYSLGCVLFEALAGTAPFAGYSPLATLVHRLTEPAPPLRSIDAAIPPPLEAVVAKALSTRPSERFATAGEMSGALERADRLGQGGEVTDPSDAHRLADASIAVLPFANLSADPEAEYFSDGMTEEIINALSQVRGLRVAARSSSFTFKGRQVEARAVGEQLRVRTLLEGSIRKVGDRVRLTAQLISVADGYCLWSQSYERTLADVFAVQDELARAISANLTQKVAGTSSGPLVAVPTGNLDAYTLYLRGRHAWSLASIDGFRTALDCFAQAVAADPQYAQAHAWLAYGYALLGFDEFSVMAPMEAMPKARAAAIRAVELDDSLGDAHFARALCAFLYEWDWGRARDEFERAMSAESASTLAQHWYALFLCASGQPDRGLQVARRAQTLDPLSLTVQVTVGRCLYYARRFEEAIDVFRLHLEQNPTSIQGYVTLYRALKCRGMLAEALLALERGINFLGRVPILLACAGYAHAQVGQRDQALALLEELGQLAERRYVPPAYQAEILFGLGDLDGAFRQWGVAAEQRSGWIPFLRADPAWDQLRTDPRHLALLSLMPPEA